MMPRLTAQERNEAILINGRPIRNAFDRYLNMAMLDGGRYVFDEGRIVRGLKKRLNDWSRGRVFGTPSPDVPELRDSVHALLEYLHENPRPITQAHSDKGIAFLRGKLFKRDGNLRTDKFASEFNTFKVRVVMEFDHFEFLGYEDRQANASGMLMHWLPVYRCVSKSGESFDYIYGAWQSASAGIEFV
jgi:hypothetical protein